MPPKQGPLLTLLVVATISLAPESVAAQTSLDAELKPYLAEYGLPAVAAAFVRSGQIVAAGAVGTRRLATGIPVTVNDRFHLGSDTKAMTALLTGMLVDEKRLRWDSTVAEIFPELVNDMGGGLRRVTVTQLLSHTSGIPSDNKEFARLLGEAMTQDGNLNDMRYWLVKQWVKQPLATEPGAAFAYSNMGYTLMGAVIEKVSGETWDELITQRVFIPLKLETAGLGCQASLGKVDAPLGHRVSDGRMKAFLAGPNGDNPLILGPAGIAHMSVLDFARWAGWNAGEQKRGPQLVRPETMRKLHEMIISMPEKKDARPGTPSHGKYGLGWGEVTVDWAAEPLMYHGGSNDMNLAHVWVNPQRDLAMVCVTNVSGAKANEALLKLAAALYAEFAKPK